jgi:hypothetical protein
MGACIRGVCTCMYVSVYIYIVSQKKLIRKFHIGSDSTIVCLVGALIQCPHSIASISQGIIPAMDA